MFLSLKLTRLKIKYQRTINENIIKKLFGNECIAQATLNTYHQQIFCSNILLLLTYKNITFILKTSIILMSYCHIGKRS